VESPEQWRWSSYRFYGLEEAGAVRVNDGWNRDFVWESGSVGRCPSTKHSLQAFVVPTLRKVREGWGTPALVIRA